MILLERGNRILGETVSSQVNRDPEEKVETFDVKLCDFDDVSYRVMIDSENKNLLSVSMAMPCYASIMAKGAEESFKKTYGALVTAPQDKYDVTVQINLDELKEAKQKEEIVAKLSTLKANTLGGVFTYFFQDVLSGKSQEPFTFTLRADTLVYFFPGRERCTVIYSIDFKEKVDRAIAKVFMQEFCEARRTLQAAPPVQFAVSPPSEMAHFKITEATGNLGFVSFAVLKSHVERDKLPKVVQVMATFRNYLQYHIKCSKAHFHARMRARVASLLQILNRAKAEPPAGTTQAKTMSGKTFNRKEKN